MAARKFHGIHAAFYGTTSGAVTTEINKVAAGESKIEFLDQENNPVTVFGNQYAGVQYAKITLRALDPTAYAAIKARWETDQKTFFKLQLDGGETWTTNQPGTLLQSCKPLDVAGEAKGRADGFDLVFQLPVSLFTIVTA
ncbi:MAG: hypothetical protein LCH53_13605 [Bacteroidetes bacterium]|nr:hypothetical protein [Bacteroidota bacterium]